MNWQPIATAPKDRYCLGFDPQLKRPFVMLWNVPGGVFSASGGGHDEAPTLWAALPPVPCKESFSGWQPMHTAPKEGYCLGYDPYLTRPFVMAWSRRKGAFSLPNGFGDETPRRWQALPPLPAAFKAPALKPHSACCA